jgi:apolipoprotein N-acyltransferase
MFALDGKKARGAFVLSYFVGLVFFIGTLYWFMYVTWLGAFLLLCYLAVYFGIFGLSYCRFSCQPLWKKIFVYSSFWVALEYVRGHLLSGFGWVGLGHSQYKNLALIQIADLTGVYGVSFLVVSVNVLIKENLAFIIGISQEKQKDLMRVNVLFLAALFAVYGYGLWQLANVAAMPYVKIGVVQGNVPQDEKWAIANRHATIEKYLKLSKETLVHEPEILIWPETSFPGLIEEMPELMEEIRTFVRESHVPILLGVVTEESSRYYNSALLIDSDGEIGQRYDKLHLVPFGEYLPFRKQFPFLADVVPIEDFSPGRNARVFRLPAQGKDVLFSVAICFEDTLAYITRRFVENGAQLLVNMTNDAWFEDSKAPFIHLQAAVFRTIETRRSLVRAANTGVSCLIDPNGRIMKYVENDKGKKTYIDGTAVFYAPLNSTSTWYTKSGDVFTYLCFLCILWAGYVRIFLNRDKVLS